MMTYTNKTKEIVIYFGWQDLTLSHLKIGESEIECVVLSKLLGLMIKKKLTWQDHVEYISSKESHTIYFLFILRRPGKTHQYTSYVCTPL